MGHGYLRQGDCLRPGMGCYGRVRRHLQKRENGPDQVRATAELPGQDSGQELRCYTSLAALRLFLEGAFC